MSRSHSNGVLGPVNVGKYVHRYLDRQFYCGGVICSVSKCWDEGVVWWSAVDLPASIQTRAQLVLLLSTAFCRLCSIFYTRKKYVCRTINISTITNNLWTIWDVTLYLTIDCDHVLVLVWLGDNNARWSLETAAATQLSIIFTLRHKTGPGNFQMAEVSLSAFK